MNQFLEVKEFETIIGNTEFKEQYQCVGEMTFSNLIQWIRSFDSDKENSEILNFVKIGYKRAIGETITFKNYVGIIQMKNQFQIQILPKIAFANGEKDATKQVFIKMLCSMNNFPGKAFTNANLQVENMNLYEIFIQMYLQEVHKLIKNGLQSDYQKREENLTVCKGKLLVTEHIKQNFAHKEYFYSEFDEYNRNRPENKLIKSTLLKLQKITTHAKTAKEIRQLLIPFKMVEPSRNYEKDFSQIMIDRTTKNYELLMKWSRVFLKDKSFTPFGGAEFARALLFPMEKLFEAYVAKHLEKLVREAGWRLSIQHKGSYLFDTLNGEKHKKFALKPDLIITREDHSVIILDTKWKRLINNKNANYGISQADMYQMYAYSKKYEASEIWLLYPLSEEMRNCGPIRFDSEDGVIVSVFLVDVARIEESLGELINRLRIS